jgi:hypothetical protein
VIIQSSHPISASTVRGRVFVANTGISDKSAKFSLAEAGTTNVMSGEAMLDNTVHGSVRHVWPFITEKKDGDLFFRVLVCGSGDAFSLLQDGKNIWSRDEALAAVSKVVFVGQRNNADDSAKISGVEFEGNLVDFRARWQHQIARLSEVSLIESKGKDGLTRSMRHKFGFDKDALCLTESGRLVSLSLESGKLHWSKFIGEANSNGNKARMFASRAHPHGSLNAEVIISIENEAGSVLYFIDAASGAVTHTKGLPIHILSVTSAGDADHQGRARLMLVGQNTRATEEVLVCLLTEGSAKHMSSYFHVVEGQTLHSYLIKDKHQNM